MLEQHVASWVAQACCTPWFSGQFAVNEKRSHV